MTRRLWWYLIAFLITLLYQILFYWIEFTGSIVLFVFLLVTFRYVFSAEELPHSEYVSDPKVHQYHRSRINTYGYIMAAAVGIVALMFYGLSRFTSLNPGPSALFFWIVLIVVSYYANKYVSSDNLKQMIVEYININTNERFALGTIQVIVAELLAQNDENQLERLKKLDLADLLQNNDLELIIDLFNKYVTSFKEKELVSGEIEAINDLSAPLSNNEPARTKDIKK